MTRLATVRSLQQRISGMQPLRAEDGLPTPPELGGLLPGGVLQRGSSTSVQGSLHLALALVSAASAAGSWCGAIGVPELGLEAAERLGIALDRFALVPDPGTRALGIAGTLSEVLAAVVLRPPSRVSHAEADRLSARLRDHGSALVVVGPWPRTSCTLRITASRWCGIGPGHGLLQSRELAVRSEDRRGLQHHTVRLEEGRLSSPASPVPARGAQPRPRLEAVSS
jgi:hypothetical protein